MPVVTETFSPRQGGEVAIPARRHRRRAVLLLALAVFQFWLWGTRIVNLLRDAGDFSTAFVTVHLGLYIAAIGAGAILAVLGARMWTEARRQRREADVAERSGGAAGERWG
jgi:hypothetical protein